MSLKTENRHVIKQHNFEALIKKRKTSENTLSYLVLVCIILRVLLYRWGFKYQVMLYGFKGLFERPFAQYIQSKSNQIHYKNLTHVPLASLSKH